LLLIKFAAEIPRRFHSF